MTYKVIGTSIGVPTKPNSSRNLLSINLLYDVSRNSVVKSTNLGGQVLTWVANLIFGCLPDLTGGGFAPTRSPKNALSLAVGIRFSQLASAVFRAGANRSRCQPVLAEILTRCAHVYRSSCRSNSLFNTSCKFWWSTRQSSSIWFECNNWWSDWTFDWITNWGS